MEPGSVDIVVLVFVISALQPDEWDRAIVNIHKVSVGLTRCGVRVAQLFLLEFTRC